MDKVHQIQRAARDNVDNLKTYLTDLNNWEKEMKRKESALRGDVEQELPPVRSKIKKEKPISKVTHKKTKTIKSTDYNAWDKFDVDVECEKVDMADVGPPSLDSRGSEEDKQSKLREEAQYEKNRGNTFVKQEKWDEAVQCYNRAIELVKDDAIYYANRGLCHLKMERLHQAESDCTQAIKLDPTYVKAYQRRAAAREKLASLRAASQDLARVLELEPHNQAARRQQLALKQRMATKGGKFKSSPVTTPTDAKLREFVPSPEVVPSPVIEEMADEPPKIREISTKVYSKADKQTDLERWLDGSADGVEIIKPINKPPHLRSKEPMKAISIEEIPLGAPDPISKPIKFTGKEEGKGDCIPDLQEIPANLNNNYLNDLKLENLSRPVEPAKLADVKITDVKMTDVKMTDVKANLTGAKKENVDISNMVPPTTSVQFITEWKNMKGNESAKRAYLNLINPEKIPSIFQNSLESDILSGILRTLASDPAAFREKGVKAFLRALSGVKRFSALAMFLSDSDRSVVKTLIQHCKEAEGCSEDEVNDLRNKYEL